MKKFKIRTAASLKKILEKKPRNERGQYQYYYLKGIYDSRMFGLCIYRLKPSCDFKNLIIYRVSGSAYRDDLLDKTHSMEEFAKQNYKHQEYYEGVINAMRNMRAHISNLYKKHYR